jgi:hypothetical protein
MAGRDLHWLTITEASKLLQARQVSATCPAIWRVREALEKNAALMFGSTESDLAPGVQDLSVAPCSRQPRLGSA